MLDSVHSSSIFFETILIGHEDNITQWSWSFLHFPSYKHAYSCNHLYNITLAIINFFTNTILSLWVHFSTNSSCSPSCFYQTSGWKSKWDSSYEHNATQAGLFAPWCSVHSQAISGYKQQHLGHKKNLHSSHSCDATGAERSDGRKQ